MFRFSIPQKTNYIDFLLKSIQSIGFATYHLNRDFRLRYTATDAKPQTVNCNL